MCRFCHIYYIKNVKSLLKERKKKYNVKLIQILTLAGVEVFYDSKSYILKDYDTTKNGSNI